MSDLKIQFLGTGDAFCSGGRFQTCFYVESDRESFLIDCGATSLMALKQNRISTAQVDDILISHFHGDHYGGIPFFLIDAFYEEKREKTLRIAGPTGVEQRVLGTLDLLYPGIDVNKFSYKIEFQEYSKSSAIQIGDLSIQSFEVVHAPESLPHALKIHVHSKCLAFSGDTGWADVLTEIANEADLFICESNFYDTEIAMHLNYKRIVKALPDLKCRKMVLNHLGPEMLAHLSRVEIDCAYDGLKLRI